MDAGGNRVWNPCKVLDLESHAASFTCVGRAPSKNNSRCRLTHLPKSSGIENVRIILDGMARTVPSSRFTSRSLPVLARLLLCETHQYQEREKIQTWTERISGFQVGYNENTRLVLRIVELESYLDALRKQFEDDRKETNIAQESLLSELAQCQQNLKEACKQSSMAMEAEEDALESCVNVKGMFDKVCEKLNETELSCKQSKCHISQLSSANSNLQSWCSRLEDQLDSQSRDLATAASLNPKMSVALIVTGKVLYPMLHHRISAQPPSPEKDVLWERIPDIARAARSAFSTLEHQLQCTQQQLSDREITISTNEAACSQLQQDLASAREEAETTKRQLTDRLNNALEGRMKDCIRINKWYTVAQKLLEQREEARDQIAIRNVSRTPCSSDANR